MAILLLQSAAVGSIRIHSSFSKHRRPMELTKRFDLPNGSRSPFKKSHPTSFDPSQEMPAIHRSLSALFTSAKPD
jgi:hypothetical protein